MSDETRNLLEDYGVSPVPSDERKGWFGIGIVYWGSAVCLPAFLVAGIIAGPMTLGSAVTAYIVGSVVLAIIAILAGVIGAHTGLSTGLSITYTFGTRGANVLQLVFFFASWGWFGVQLGFMASGLGDGGLAFALGGAVPGWVLQILGGALMTLTAMFGFKALERLSVLVVPFLILVLLITTFRVYSGGVSFAEAASASVEGAMPVGVAISIIISSFILGAIIAPDMTRYAKSTRAAGGGMLFGMLIGFPVILTLAAIMIKGAGGEPDFSKIMLAEPSGLWGILAVLTIVLAAWTTNDNNLYSGALSLNAMFPKAKKWMITLLSGIVGTGLALAGINTSGGFQAFLGILGVVIPPAAAVMLVDFFAFRADHGYDSSTLADVPAVRTEPLIAWGIGTVVGFVIQYTPFQMTSVTAIDTILVSAVAYFVIAKIRGGQANPA